MMNKTLEEMNAALNAQAQVEAERTAAALDVTAAEQEEAAAYLVLNKAGASLKEAETERERFRSRPPAPHLVDRNRVEIARLTTERDTAKAAREQARERTAAAHKKLDDLNARAQQPLYANRSTVLASQDGLTEARAKVETLRNAAAKIESELLSPAQTDPRAAIAAARADVLAKIALGEMDPEALAAFDKEHAAKVKAAEANSAKLAAVRSDLEQTREAIAARLTAAQTELDDLTDRHSRVLIAYLDSEREAAAREYQITQQQANELRSQMVSLCELLRMRGHQVSPGPLLVQELAGGVQTEVARLKAQGVAL